MLLATRVEKNLKNVGSMGGGGRLPGFGTAREPTTTCGHDNNNNIYTHHNHRGNITIIIVVRHYSMGTYT